MILFCMCNTQCMCVHRKVYSCMRVYIYIIQSYKYIHSTSPSILDDLLA